MLAPLAPTSSGTFDPPGPELVDARRELPPPVADPTLDLAPERVSAAWLRTATFGEKLSALTPACGRLRHQPRRAWPRTGLSATAQGLDGAWPRWRRTSVAQLRPCQAIDPGLERRMSSATCPRPHVLGHMSTAQVRGQNPRPMQAAFAAPARGLRPVAQAVA